MNKKIMYTFIPAVAAFGALVGFKSSGNKSSNKVAVTNNINNKAINATNKINNDCNDQHVNHDNWTGINTSYFAQKQSLALTSGSYYLTGNID